MRRLPINITPAERLARVAVGLAGAIAGVWLLASASGAGLVILEVMLILAGPRPRRHRCARTLPQE